MPDLVTAKLLAAVAEFIACYSEPDDDDIPDSPVPLSTSTIGPLDMATLYPAGTMRPAMNKIAKFDEEQGLVFGWASVAASPDGETVVDAHADIIEPEELERAAYEYVLKFGDTGQMHTGGSVGRLVESLVFTPDKAKAMGIPQPMASAWWVGFKLDDPEVFQKVKDGTYPMFSVQGLAESEPVDG